MSFTGKSNSEKPQRVEGDSFPGPINPIGDPHSKQAKVEASFSSGLTKLKADTFPGPIKPIGDPHSKQAKAVASISSGLTKLKDDSFPGPIKPIGTPDSKNCKGTINHNTKTGFSSGVRGKAAVSSAVKGKAIVSAKVMAFKDVKYGLHDGELRFRLIHFWEARNVVTKVLLGGSSDILGKMGTTGGRRKMAHGEDNENFERLCYWMLEQELMHIVFVQYLEVKVVIRRLSPASFHAAVAKTCFELKNQLITASYVDDETSM
ncbi:unnamed protein product [Brassica rapa]|uniref:CG-1 domain-containing protein n=2 Tax=Brassica TaxID=3705 RepID=A0A8D9GGP6_BRACM|nr:unnamed protein product [Brassica napus]CAG7860973.1 unnamed protein product [Brassica rapa]CAG7880323.1 unnamed protein product [Brassica rapa]